MSRRQHTFKSCLVSDGSPPFSLCLTQRSITNTHLIKIKNKHRSPRVKLCKAKDATAGDLSGKSIK